MVLTNICLNNDKKTIRLLKSQLIQMFLVKYMQKINEVLHFVNSMQEKLYLSIVFYCGHIIISK
jgi:hypothetical protein